MGNEAPILEQEKDADDSQVNDLTAKEENLDDGLDTKETEETADDTKSVETGDEKDEKPVELSVEEQLAIKDKEIGGLKTMLRQIDRDFRKVTQDQDPRRMQLKQGLSTVHQWLG